MNFLTDLPENVGYVTLTGQEIVDSLGKGNDMAAGLMTLDVINRLMAAQAANCRLDPSELTASEAHTHLDTAQRVRDEALRWKILLGENYPAHAKMLDAALTVALFASATAIPSLMLGNKTVESRKKSCVSTYIVQSKESGLIKIGRSISPEERIKSLQTGAGCQLQVLAIVREDIEAKLHKQFRDLRTFGEWFTDDGRIAAYALHLTRQPPKNLTA